MLDLKTALLVQLGTNIGFIVGPNLDSVRMQLAQGYA